MGRLRFWVVLMVLALSSMACAENRFALVIGIDDYQNVPKLIKAGADARAMSAQLETLGFAVTPLLNPGRRQIYAALSVLTGKLQPGDTILLHYSGHGVQIDGDNFLLPADIPSTGQSDKEFLKSEAVSVSTLVDRFRATGVRVQILIIDACRDNPYASAGTRSIGATRGLAPPPAPPKGTFIMFSAGQGQTALDALDPQDKEPTSPYTRLLLKKMRLEGKPLPELARELRDEVEAAANLVQHEQRPAYYDELSGSPFYFVAPKSVAGPTPANLPNAAPQRDLATELAFWDYIKGATSAELFDVYLQKYGDGGQFAAIARIESARLKRLASLPPAKPADAVAPPATGTTGRPAFDCALARSNVENAICNNGALAEKDRALNDVFRQLAANQPGNDLTGLQNSQRNWRSQRDTCNSAVVGNALDTCIARSYDTRLAQLRRMTSGAPTSVAQGDNTPSFDCSAARTLVERQICQDPLLAARDRQLAVLFGGALARLNGAQRDSTIADQSAWLRQRDYCANLASAIPKCIADAYDRRLGALRAGR